MNNYHVDYNNNTFANGKFSKAQQSIPMSLNEARAFTSNLPETATYSIWHDINGKLDLIESMIEGSAPGSRIHEIY